MNIQGNANIKQLQNIEGNNNTVSGGQTLTEHTTIEQALQEKDPQTRAILEEKVIDLKQAIQQKEPTKVQKLLKAIQDIAPDVARITATTLANPIAGLGLIVDHILS